MTVVVGDPSALPAHSIGDPAVLTFIILPLVVAAAFVGAVAIAWRRSGASAADSRRAAFLSACGAAAWMAATGLAARSGVLRHWDWTPPPFLALPIGILALGVAIAAGPIGRRFAAHLPLWWLVASQSFRLPLELAMHALSGRGIMPVHMSYSGRNLDIVTGATAVIVAILFARGYAGRRLVLAWNVLGLGLLVNVVTVAILSTPRFAAFGPDRLNVFVTYAPFVWLPAVLVLAALTGHLVIFRALRRE
ncbi:MAG TPA: hypothetical protein VGD94_15500 [Vicinamibacterales bacterium]